jgi:CubicO group peptidase (beta-lactamase class C family)
VTAAPNLRVRNLLARGIAAGQFPGAAAAWGSSESALSICVAGAASIRPRRRAVSENTWFDLASLTKPLVTTTLVLRAFRNGDFGPATRVGEILGESEGAPVGELEVRHLLTHSSGVPGWLPFYCLAEGRRENLAEVVRGIPVEAPPGSRVVYSCVGFIILGLMLERRSGRSLADLFHTEVLVPAKLEDELGFSPDMAVREVVGGAVRSSAEERLILELGLDPKWIPPVGPGLADDGNARFLGGAAGNAGLFGSVRGVYRLMAEYLGRGGVILTEDDALSAVKSQTPGLEQERGYGWQIATSDGCSAGAALPNTAFGHTGFTGVSVWAEPGGGRIAVLLTNRNHPGQRGVDLHPVRRRFHSLAFSA